MKRLSPLQLRRLQTLYSAAISRELGSNDSREARLAWASNAIGHSVESFSDLTSAEAKNLIDNLQSEIGQAETEPALPGRLDRDRAQAAGTEGRKNDPRAMATLVSPEDLQRVNDAVARLGWNQNQFEGWLRSSSSPLRGAKAIRTLGDANRVWWALKKMLKRQGKWTGGSAA